MKNISKLNKETLVRVVKMNSSKLSHFVIIGAGAVGVTVFRHLVMKAIRVGIHNIRITIIDRDSKIGGLAFQECLSEHITNTPNLKMSTHPFDEGEFVDYLQNNLSEIKAQYQDFDLSSGNAPRLVVGDYLEYSYMDALREAKQYGIQVERIVSEVISLQSLDEGTLVRLSNGRAILSDLNILAIGNRQKSLGKRFAKYQNFIDKPWPMSSWLNEMDNHKNVMIIGSSLTSVDIAYSLASRNKVKKIIMLSKNGLLPETQVPNKIPHTLKYIPQELSKLLNLGKKVRMSQLADMIGIELMHAGLGLKDLFRFFPKNESAYLTLKDELENLEDPIKKLGQEVIDSLSPIIPDMWYLLRNEDRIRFKRFVFSHYKRVKHPQILRNAKRMLELMESGCLQIVSSDYNQIACEKDVFKIELDQQVFSASYLINGIGMDYNFKGPLVNDLKDEGLAINSEWGGLSVEEFSNRLITRRGLSPNIYAIGSITHGDKFFTNSFPINSVTIDKVTDNIINEITGNPSQSLREAS